MPNTPFIIDLGCEAEDRITGMKGIITARAQNLYGCNTYYIQPKIKKDGEDVKGKWCDELGVKVLAIPKKEKVAPPFPG